MKSCSARQEIIAFFYYVYFADTEFVLKLRHRNALMSLIDSYLPITEINE